MTRGQSANPRPPDRTVAWQVQPRATGAGNAQGLFHQPKIAGHAWQVTDVGMLNRIIPRHVLRS